MCLAICLLWIPLYSVVACSQPAKIEQLHRFAVIYNERDAVSVASAEYYRLRRGIPASQLIAISFDPAVETLSRYEFQRLYREVNNATPSHVQFLVLAWTATVRVECMSITSAFAFGIIPGQGNLSCEQTCAIGATNPYAMTPVSAPFQYLNMRPTMMLAGKNLAAVKALVDRGVAADNLKPEVHGALLLATNDKPRSVRQVDFDRAVQLNNERITIQLQHGDHGSSTVPLMFYFTGQVRVPGLTEIQFLPGAIADHLTSFGGRLLNSQGQMSALEWLEAGATGSYGTVVEPCNHLEKFPRPSEVMRYYLNGDMLIEAYWKSVLSPTQGVFIGEPMAAPYR